MNSEPATEGILLVDKCSGKSSFNLVCLLRKRFKIKKIGHAGTLDPLATGLMVMLIGPRYTKISESLLTSDKEYDATIFLGAATDTYDAEGKALYQSDKVPTIEEIHKAIQSFQGTIQQVPPLFSAKKIQGKKCYELARQGKTIARAPITVEVHTTFIEYNYPFLKVNVNCSKGTYIRSIAQDIGELLGCGAHLSALRRIRSGNFHIQNAIPHSYLLDLEKDLLPFLLKQV